MPWEKHTWVDDDGSGTTGTLYTAARMNNIETGIDENKTAIANEVTARAADVDAEESARIAAVKAEKEAREAAVTAALAASQPLDSDLTAIAALSTTEYGRSFLALVDAAAARTKLGLGTAAVEASSAFDAAGAASAAQAASQPLDSDLTAIAALTTTAFGRELLTLADAAAARTKIAAASTTALTAEETARKEADTTEKAAREAADGLLTTKAETAAADWKNSCRAATTANITIATALNNADTLDGVTLATGDRVLVKNQTTKSENGIWVVGVTPVRATDADAAGELSGGTSVYIEQGTINKQRTFKILTAGSITPGTTAHEWDQLYPKDFGLVSSVPTSEALPGDHCTYKAVAGEVLWRFVYDGEGELPWKKIGGPALYNEVVDNQGRTSSTYGDLATVGPSITLPLKGDYMVAIGAGAYDSGTVVTDAQMSYAIGASAAQDADGCEVNTFSLPSNVSATIPGGIMRERKKTGLAAVALVAKYKSSANSGSATATFYNRWMRADPIRVG